VDLDLSLVLLVLPSSIRAGLQDASATVRVRKENTLRASYSTVFKVMSTRATVRLERTEF
jgi:hypothetical protein